jgi:hypothetical protein
MEKRGIIEAKRVEVSEYKKEEYEGLDMCNVVSKEQVDEVLVKEILKMIICRLTGKI